MVFKFPEYLTKVSTFWLYYILVNLSGNQATAENISNGKRWTVHSDFQFGIQYAENSTVHVRLTPHTHCYLAKCLPHSHTLNPQLESLDIWLKMNTQMCMTIIQKNSNWHLLIAQYMSTLYINSSLIFETRNITITFILHIRKTKVRNIKLFS